MPDAKQGLYDKARGALRSMLGLHDDEATPPVFIVDATDPLFAPVVRTWARAAQERGYPEADIKAALDLAHQGHAWITAHPQQPAVAPAPEA